MRLNIMSRKYFFVLLLSLHHISQSYSLKEPPGVTKTEIQSQLTGRVDENFRLTCPIRAEPEPIFEWYRDGSRITALNSDRYKFMSKGNILSITRLECEDEGTYTCKGINGFGVNEFEFQLTVLAQNQHEFCKDMSDEEDLLIKPTVLFKPKKPKRLLKPSGNYASLKCIATGDPLPKFQWFKGGMEILQERSLAYVSPKYVIRSTVLGEEDLADTNAVEAMRSTLQISDLRGSDTANYTCRAFNQHGWDELTQALDVVEPQTPSRPELHPEFPPSYIWMEPGQAGSLSCKVFSDFPPEIHWLKRITPLSRTYNALQPRLPTDEEVESMQPQFVPNGTLTIGDAKYQILPSAPATLSNDVYTSILILSKRIQDKDSGYYICLAFNSAGYNFRQVYLNVTKMRDSFGGVEDDLYLLEKQEEHLNEKNRNEAITTALVVVVVVICGVSSMIISCFVWKRRKNHLRDKTLSLPSVMPNSSNHLSSQQPHSLRNPVLPPSYVAFRDGLTNSSFGTPSPTSANTKRPDPGQQLVQNCLYQNQDPTRRVLYSPARRSPIGSPRQKKMVTYPAPYRVSSTKGVYSGYRSNNSSRTNFNRSSPTSNSRHFAEANLQRADEVESLTNDSSSFMSEMPYSDIVSHNNQNVRLPYPSPETSFD